MFSRFSQYFEPFTEYFEALRGYVLWRARGNPEGRSVHVV